MFKRIIAIMVLLMFMFSTIPAFAADCHRGNVQRPVIYKSVINVTERGGVYQVGFATLIFPKDFISGKKLPIRLNVEISAVNGVAGIEVTPDIPRFNKDVTILVHSYKGLLYDKTLKKNIPVRIKNQRFTVKHFSRYAFS